MAQTLQRDTHVGLSDTARHWITAALAVVGVVAATIGAWLAYGPEDATIRVLDWTWTVGDISSLWAPWLMIGGGVLASIGMAWETFRADDDVNVWIRSLEVLLLVAGVAAIGVGLFLLI